MQEAALNLMRFFEDESCGQCTPCRIGTEKAVKLMERSKDWDKAAAGRAVAGDARRLDLRPGPGCAQPAAERDQVLPGGGQPSGGRAHSAAERTAESGSRHERRDHLRARRQDGRGRPAARPSGRSPSATGSTIPHLCYTPEPGYRADGNCRACMVEIEGERVLAASCLRKPPRA